MPRSEGHTITGNSHAGSRQHIPLPAPTVRAGSHRPWCVDCKRTHDPGDLDDDQRCGRCAHAAVTRAAAAERRAADEAAAKAAAKAQPAATPPATRPSQPTSRRPRGATTSTTSDESPKRLKGGYWTRGPGGVQVWKDGPDPSTVKPARPASTPRPPKPKGPSKHAIRRLELQRTLVREYATGRTAPALAKAHKITPATVRRLLDLAGVQRRDDRGANSGGYARPLDPTEAADVRRLYIDDQQSMSDVAAHLGMSVKRVETIMRKAGIPARRGQTGRVDGAAAMREQMAALGVTAAEVKQWAGDNGFADDATKRGLPSQRIVTAYANAAKQPNPPATGS